MLSKKHSTWGGLLEVGNHSASFIFQNIFKNIQEIKVQDIFIKYMHVLACK